MAVATGIYVLKNSSVTFDAIEFNNQMNKAELVPDQPIQQMRMLAPSGTVTDVDSPLWTFDIGGGQSWDEDGFCKFLSDHQGEEVEVVYQPRLGSGQEVATFTVIAMTPNFGGTQGAFKAFELSLPVQGQPVFSTSV